MIRRMVESDLEAVDRIFRLAFGTFIGLPDPMKFAAGKEYVRSRWLATPEGALTAEIDGEVAGSNFATAWGSFGYFGPLTTRPELWNRGIAKELLAPTMELFERWGVREAGLFTFPQSTKHIALYQKFGFWPRFLTALMGKTASAHASEFTKFSTLTPERKAEAIEGCRKLTDSIFDGLDVRREVEVVESQKLGDTVLIWGGRLEGFAVCHCGAGTEAGPDACYIKFAAADSARNFERLVDACESFAAERGMARIETGVNTAREEAYRAMLARGFRTVVQGVAMQRPNGAGYNRPGVFLLDDWR